MLSPLEVICSLRGSPESVLGTRNGAWFYHYRKRSLQPKNVVATNGTVFSQMCFVLAAADFAEVQNQVAARCFGRGRLAGTRLMTKCARLPVPPAYTARRFGLHAVICKLDLSQQDDAKWDTDFRVMKHSPAATRGFQRPLRPFKRIMPRLQMMSGR